MVGLCDCCQLSGMASPHTIYSVYKKETSNLSNYMAHSGDFSQLCFTCESCIEERSYRKAQKQGCRLLKIRVGACSFILHCLFSHEIKEWAKQ